MSQVVPGSVNRCYAAEWRQVRPQGQPRYSEGAVASRMCRVSMCADMCQYAEVVKARQAVQMEPQENN